MFCTHFTIFLNFFYKINNVLLIMCTSDCTVTLYKQYCTIHITSILIKYCISSHYNYCRRMYTASEYYELYSNITTYILQYSTVFEYVCYMLYCIRISVCTVFKYICMYTVFEYIIWIQYVFNTVFKSGMSTHPGPRVRFSGPPVGFFQQIFFYLKKFFFNIVSMNYQY